MLLAILGLAVASATAPAAPCGALLPRGPAVPAPIVLWTSCGGFRLAPDGQVSRLPRRWLAAHGGGTGRRYGADLKLRRTRAGRIVLLRGRRVVWRSSRLYRNDGGSVAFGPGTFAFAAYRRGVFLTDLRGPERLVAAGKGLYPHDFTRGGRLLVIRPRAIALLSPDGRRERRYAYHHRLGWTFDAATDTLLYATPRGRLATLRGQRLRVGRSLGGIDGWMSVGRGGLLVFAGSGGIVVLRRDGTPVARTRWPGSRLQASDSGVSISPDGRAFAFRLSNARPGSSKGRAAVYVFRAGDERPRLVYRHRLGPPGCAAGATIAWHGRFLLYRSVDGQLAVLDSTGQTRPRDLRRLARALPRRYSPDPAVGAWESEFPR